MTRIALIGDVHRSWTERDVDYFNASAYDAILFVGDLPAYRPSTVLSVAKSIAKLRIPGWVIPGNHDATTLRQLLSEGTGIGSRSPRIGRQQALRVEALRQALGPITLGGYSHHPIDHARDLGLICARPHAMGGGISFASYIKLAFGISSIKQSAARLCALIDECPQRRLIILAHHGPSGLGAKQDDIWGCDFKAQGGDWGDADLRQAIDYAVAKGRQIVAVVAGHMHQRTKGGAQRTWHLEREGIAYVNAARVPRIFRAGDERMHHHVALVVKDQECQVKEVLIPSRDLRP